MKYEPRSQKLFHDDRLTMTTVKLEIGTQKPVYTFLPFRESCTHAHTQGGELMHNNSCLCNFYSSLECVCLCGECELVQFKSSKNTAFVQ